MARIRKSGFHTEFWWENLLDSDNFEDQTGDERVILRTIMGKCVVGVEYGKNVRRSCYLMAHTDVSTRLKLLLSMP